MITPTSRSLLPSADRNQVYEIQPRRNDRIKRRTYQSHARHNCHRDVFLKERTEEIVVLVDRRLLNARASFQLTVRTIGGPLCVCASAIPQCAPTDDRLSVTQPGRDAHDSSTDTPIDTQEEYRARNLGRCFSIVRDCDRHSKSADTVRLSHARWRESFRASLCCDRSRSARRRSRRRCADRRTGGL